MLFAVGALILVGPLLAAAVPAGRAAAVGRHPVVPAPGAGRLPAARTPPTRTSPTAWPRPSRAPARWRRCGCSTPTGTHATTDIAPVVRGRALHAAPAHGLVPARRDRLRGAGRGDAARRRLVLPAGLGDARRRSPPPRSTCSSSSTRSTGCCRGSTSCRSAAPRWPGCSASGRTCRRTGRPAPASPAASGSWPATSASPMWRAATCCTASTCASSRASGWRSSARPAPASPRWAGCWPASTRPRTGAVTVGGVPLADLPLDELRWHVALVTQEHHVFIGTLRDNLALARPGASDAEVRAALAAVDALGWVARCPTAWTPRSAPARLALSAGPGAAAGAGPAGAGRPAHPGPRRGDVAARPARRPAPGTFAGRRAGGPHGDRHRAPALLGARRRPGRGGRGRPDHRARLATTNWSPPAARTPRCGAPGTGPPSPLLTRAPRAPLSWPRSPPSGGPDRPPPVRFRALADRRTRTPCRRPWRTYRRPSPAVCVARAG